MTLAEDPSSYDALQHWLEPAEDYLSAVEAHGLICAMAIHPEPPAHWAQQIAPESQLPDELTAIVQAQHQRLAAQLASGDGVQLPCRLDPFEELPGEDVTAWCTGFMAGVFLSPEDWPQGSDDTDNPLLPFVLIAGLDDDPELDKLWEDSKLVRQMASAIPAVMEDLFLELREINVS